MIPNLLEVIIKFHGLFILFQNRKKRIKYKAQKQGERHYILNELDNNIV